MFRSRILTVHCQLSSILPVSTCSCVGATVCAGILAVLESELGSSVSIAGGSPHLESCVGSVCCQVSQGFPSG